MADRYVLIEVNEDGEGRLKDEAVTWIDFRLSIVDFNASEGLNQLMEQISKDVKDELVLVLLIIVLSPLMILGVEQLNMKTSLMLNFSK